VAVRIAKVEDVPAIFDLGQQMLNRMYGPGRVKANRTSGYSEMRMLIQSKTGLVIVDEIEGEIAGVLAAQRMKQAFCDHWIAVDLAYFVEENKPITAMKLVRHYLWWAQQQKGVNEALINVTHGVGDVERAKELFVKLGMTHVGGSFAVRFNKLARAEAA
jgi:hypothetical protein